MFRAIRTGCTVLFAFILTGLAVWGGSLPAQAVPDSVTVTPTTTTAVNPNATTQLDGMKLTGADPDATREITVSTRLGTLTFPENDGLTLAFGNDWTGTDTVTFTGTQADVNTALAAAELVTGDTAGQTTSVSITATPSAPGYVYSPDNGHFYTFVELPDASWSDSLADAATQTFQGQQGYLASIPDARINQLVANRLEGARNVWLGAKSVDTFGDGDAIKRSWQWAAGPLTGDPISYCTNVNGACDFVNDSGLYHSWASGEPNDAGVQYDDPIDEQGPIPGSGEDYAVTNWQGSVGLWNDLPDNVSTFMISGYVAEFGDQVDGASTFPGVVTAASDVRIAGAPDAPTDVTATRGNGSAQLSFTPPADNGSTISGYTVTVSPGGTTQSCTDSPCTITGLTNGTSYTFTVVANSDRGDGTTSDASNAVVPATVPGAPTQVSATGGNTSATVSFTAPDDDGGSGITDYTVTADPGGAQASCASSPCVVESLDNGTSYRFTVVATNAVGDSDPSDASAAVAVRSVPGAPTIDKVEADNASATVTFSAPEDNGGADITGYTVTSSPDGIITSCDDSPCTVSGLTNGTGYTFRVTAQNEAGTSASSVASDPVTPATTPGSPTDLTVTRGSTSADLSFDAPTGDGGAAITGYQVSTDDGGTWTDLDTSGTAPITATVTGLTNGTSYSIAVRAVNRVGHGAATSRSNVTPAGSPDAPTGVTTNPGDRSVDVSWADPADNGSAITGYTVVVSEQGQDDYPASCPSSPCTIDGLRNGHHYTFAVRATNDVGDSELSDPSAVTTPATVADAPDLLLIESLDRGVTFAFEPGASDGGTDVIGYQVSVNGGPWRALTSSSVSGSIRSATLTGLSNGAPVTVRIRAANAAGVSEPSNAGTQTPATVPDAPRNVKAVTGNGKVTLSWNTPSSTGGSPIVGYVVLVQETNEECDATRLSCTFTDLAAGSTYHFTVQADNTATGRAGTGASAPAPLGPVLITDVPGAPTALSVQPGDRILGLRFTAPAKDGGKAITGYQVSIDAGKRWSALKTTSGRPIAATVVPVLNGVTYPVLVRAVNANGAGPASALVSVHTVAWFSDLVSKADRAKEVKVPTDPASYHGKVVHTVATGRSHHGTTAYPVDKLKARQLQTMQAVEVGGSTFFPDKSTKLNDATKKAIKALALSLRYDTSVSCEGYSDYGSLYAGETALSMARAKAVCAELGKDAPQLTRRLVLTYSSLRPEVIGGKPADRTANNRVVVVVNQ